MIAVIPFLILEETTVKFELLIRKFDVEVNDLFDSLATSSGSTIIDEKGVRNIKVPDPDFSYPKAGFYNIKNIKPTIYVTIFLKILLIIQ